MLASSAAACAACNDNRPHLTQPPRNLPCIAMRTITPSDLPMTWEIPMGILSQNATTYRHWSAYAKDKRRWLLTLAVALRDLRGLRLARSRWRIVRIYGGRHREMDLANLIGGAKPIPDCLTKLGVIVDDKPSCFSCDYEQVRDETGRNLTVLQLLSVQ
jgi:hypothetical protein